jgi:hypothetical protein
MRRRAWAAVVGSAARHAFARFPPASLQKRAISNMRRPFLQ